MSDKKSIDSFLNSIKEAGFTKLGFIAAAIVIWMLGITPFGIPLGWCAVSIAVYVNANTIWKWIMRGLKKPIDI